MVPHRQVLVTLWRLLPLRVVTSLAECLTLWELQDSFVRAEDGYEMPEVFRHIQVSCRFTQHGSSRLHHLRCEEYYEDRGSVSSLTRVAALGSTCVPKSHHPYCTISSSTMHDEYFRVDFYPFHYIVFGVRSEDP